MFTRYILYKIVTVKDADDGEGRGGPGSMLEKCRYC